MCISSKRRLTALTTKPVIKTSRLVSARPTEMRANGNRVTITYGRPYSIKPGTTEVRKIWGGLVPWGKADRMGSDEATLLLTQQSLQRSRVELTARDSQPAGATLSLLEQRRRNRDGSFHNSSITELYCLAAGP